MYHPPWTRCPYFIDEHVSSILSHFWAFISACNKLFFSFYYYNKHLPVDIGLQTLAQTNDK
jgi:hypothetical protein